jgi:hypothetical protein
MILLKILLVLVGVSVFLFGILAMSIWIHINKRGTKIWNFVINISSQMKMNI